MVGVEVCPLEKDILPLLLFLFQVCTLMFECVVFPKRWGNENFVGFWHIALFISYKISIDLQKH